MSYPLKIVAVWSCPRLGFMDSFASIYQTLPPHGIKLVRAMGAFWGQGLERIMCRVIADDAPDALLCLDYDAVFGPDDVQRLIHLYERMPEAAVIAAHQWNRGVDRPLWNRFDGAQPEETDDLFEVDTAHFGLTLIRTSALADLPHPWFLGVPNAEGKWEDGKLDDDIYFWRLLAKHGRKVYLAPRVVIGHAELCLRWPGKNGKTVWQHTNEYHNSGKPKDAFAATTAPDTGMSRPGADDTGETVKSAPTSAETVKSARKE